MTKVAKMVENFILTHFLIMAVSFLLISSKVSPRLSSSFFLVFTVSTLYKLDTVHNVPAVPAAHTVAIMRQLGTLT